MAYGESPINSNDTATNLCIGESFRKGQPGVPVACHLLEHPLIVCPQLSSSNLDRSEGLSSLPLRDASTDNGKETVFSQVQTSPAVHVHRPRAVLSSPDNDQMLSELQGQPKLLSYVSRQPPKAPPTPLEESYCQNGIPNQFPKALSPGSKRPILKGTEAVAIPSKKLVGGQAEKISASRYQDETKCKSFVGNGTELAHNPATQKLDVEDGKVLLTRNKDQFIRKHVSSASATQTKVKKEIHTSADRNKTRRISGFQGARPWY